MQNMKIFSQAILDLVQLNVDIENEDRTIIFVVSSTFFLWTSCCYFYMWERHYKIQWGFVAFLAHNVLIVTICMLREIRIKEGRKRRGIIGREILDWSPKATRKFGATSAKRLWMWKEIVQSWESSKSPQMWYRGRVRLH